MKNIYKKTIITILILFSMFLNIGVAKAEPSNSHPPTGPTEIYYTNCLGGNSTADELSGGGDKKFNKKYKDFNTNIISFDSGNCGLVGNEEKGLCLLYKSSSNTSSSLPNSLSAKDQAEFALCMQDKNRVWSQLRYILRDDGFTGTEKVNLYTSLLDYVTISRDGNTAEVQCNNDDDKDSDKDFNGVIMDEPCIHKWLNENYKGDQLQVSTDDALNAIDKKLKKAAFIFDPLLYYIHPNAKEEFNYCSKKSGTTVSGCIRDWYNKCKENGNLNNCTADGSADKSTKSINTNGTTYEPKCSDVEFLSKIWRALTILAPFLLIICVSFDYYSAVIANNEEKMQAVKQKTPKRIIAFVLFILTPWIIALLLNIFKDNAPSDATSSASNITWLRCIATGDYANSKYDSCTYIQPWIIRILKNLIFDIQITVPFALIIWGSLDFFKALIANDENEMKKKRKPFVRRLIYAIIILILPALVNILLKNISSSTNSNFAKCWNSVTIGNSK